MTYFDTVTLKNGILCEVRTADAKDAEEVLRCFLQTHGETENLASYEDENTITLESECEFIKRTKDSENAIELLAIIGERVVGIASFSPVSRLEKLKHRASFGVSVERAYWGLGIGRFLTEKCILLAGEAGFKSIELEVIADNTSAISLYEKLGFERFGYLKSGMIKRCGEPQDLIYMIKQL